MLERMEFRRLEHKLWIFVIVLHNGQLRQMLHEGFVGRLSHPCRCLDARWPAFLKLSRCIAAQEASQPRLLAAAVEGDTLEGLCLGLDRDHQNVHEPVLNLSGAAWWSAPVPDGIGTSYYMLRAHEAVFQTV